MFEGLFIYNNWDFCEKNQHPVIRISFDEDRNDTQNMIDENIISQLESIEKYYGIEPKKKTGLDKFFIGLRNFCSEIGLIKYPNRGIKKFKKLMLKLRKKTGKKVVVLIDEYDKPILDVITDKDQALDNREYLRDFYGTFKANEEYIHFIFITGISLMSKMNLFSSMNNLVDISILSEYSTLCGYTENELKSVFADELKRFDFEEIRKWYDGYQWDDDNQNPKVFCPHSVLNLFDEKKFKNFWYKDCIPYYVYELFKSKNLNSIELTDRWVDSGHLDRFELEKIKIDSLLFQSGFLTIKDIKEIGKRTKYLLSFPNEEVKRSLSWELLKYLTGSDLSDVEAEGFEILKLLTELDADGMQKSIYKIFKDMPYYWHGSYNKDEQDIDKYETKTIRLSKYEVGMQA